MKKKTLFVTYKKEIISFSVGVALTAILVLGTANLSSFQASFFDIVTISGTRSPELVASPQEMEQQYSFIEIEEFLYSFFTTIEEADYEDAYHMTSEDFQKQIGFLYFVDLVSEWNDVNYIVATKQKNTAGHHYFVSFLSPGKTGDSLHPYTLFVDISILSDGLKIRAIDTKVFFQGRVIEKSNNTAGTVWIDILNTGNVDWNIHDEWINSIDYEEVDLLPELQGRNVISPGELGRFEIEKETIDEILDFIPRNSEREFDIKVYGKKMPHWDNLPTI